MQKKEDAPQERRAGAKPSAARPMQTAREQSSAMVIFDVQLLGIC